MKLITMIELFLEESSKIINDWKNMNEIIINKSKEFQENKTSIETLEKNMGKTELILKLKSCLDEKEMEDYIIKLKELEEKILNIKKICLNSFSLLLKIYEKTINETVITINKDEDIDPKGIEVLKILYERVDNLQLRCDPPISGIYKDDFRKNKLNLNEDEVKKENIIEIDGL